MRTPILTSTDTASLYYHQQYIQIPSYPLFSPALAFAFLEASHWEGKNPKNFDLQFPDFPFN